MTVQGDLRAGLPTLWFNPSARLEAEPQADVGTVRIGRSHIDAARDLLQRCAPLLTRLFPELAVTGGRIESPLLPAPRLQQALALPAAAGQLWVKADHALPVAGSIKARGGLHEVLQFAERIALDNGVITADGDRTVLADAPARAVFGRYRVAVGSTGNLGLAIGIAAAALGFSAVVHMSVEAREWKKARLRDRGVEVIEHRGNYEQAVAAGRKAAEDDPRSHFVDDERSLSLLLGYACAAPELARQFAAQGLRVDQAHPLFVYLPCGVGGAPAGVTFGLRQWFGPHVHAFFVEPTQSPAFVLQMRDETGGHPSVEDLGLGQPTEADGLAVPRASLLAAAAMRPLLAGCLTVDDSTLLRHLFLAHREEGLRIEPSAAAGFSGPQRLCGTEAGRDWLRRTGLADTLPRATHLVWTTGGSLVPDAQFLPWLTRGATA